MMKRSVFDDDCYIPEIRDNGTGIILRAEYHSPFDPPIGGVEYCFSDEVVSGLCPVCNSENHQAIDRMIIETMDLKECSRAFGLLEYELEHHIVEHLLPVYGTLAEELVGRIDPDKENVDSKIKKLVKKIDAVAKVNRYDILKKIRNDTSVISRLGGDRQFHPFSEEITELAKDIGSSGDTGEYKNRDDSNDRYMPWTKERTMREIAKRQAQALDFYQEMVEIKSLARAVYSEIMGSTEDQRTIVIKNNTSVVAKNYGAAISALNVEKGVLETLAKMAILKARLTGGDEVEEKETLSPAVGAALDSILGGRKADEVISVADAGKEEVELLKDAMPSPVRIEMTKALDDDTLPLEHSSFEAGSL